jgi:hypothetical protein
MPLQYAEELRSMPDSVVNSVINLAEVGPESVLCTASKTDMSYSFLLAGGG